MGNVVKAKIKADLNPLGKPGAECEATIQFDMLDRPEEMRVSVSGLAPVQIAKLTEGDVKLQSVFGNAAISGRLEDGTAFDASVVFLKGIEFGSGQEGVWVRCYLGDYMVKPTDEPPQRRTWVFRLANLRLAVGDSMTPRPVPATAVPPARVEEYKRLLAEWHSRIEGRKVGQDELDQRYGTQAVLGGVRCNRITFQVAGRTWHLDDDLHNQWPDRLDKIGEAIASGTLTTPVQDGDTTDALQRSATDITELLTFAHARDVKWASFGYRDAAGRYIPILQRNPGILPFNQHGFTLVDNWEGGNLKSFLEVAGLSLIADRDWWSVTIGLLMQARASKYMEVKCSLLNTLLDRITTKVNGEATTPEIDEALDAKLDGADFRVALHYILSSLTPKWERHRTDSLCDNVIKGWNAEPSFPEKVARACEMLGIKAPARSKLGFRHKIIHTGEFDKKLKTVEQKADYLFGTEALVLILLVRMLKFDGLVYIRKFHGDTTHHTDAKNVSEFLAQESQQNGGK